MATVNIANSRFGQILVDGSGRTLYLFKPDTGTSSTCYGSCAQLWPPLLTFGPPQAGPGVSASLLTTSRRTDGTTQVDYAGHPLYLWVQDQKPGDTTGQGLDNAGGLWYVIAPSGQAITTS